ncbi:MAG: FAD-binding oxidoreductase [candidate division Zixibacteria bacterium]
MNKQLEIEISGDYPDGLTWQKTIPTFHPESAEQVADIFHRANDAEQTIFISGFGNNIDPAGDKFTDFLVFKSDRLNDIIEIHTADFYLTVGAGYPLKEVNKELTKKNLWFPFGDTHYPGSFGGALAAGLAADDGAHTIPFSKSLLSLTAVLADGTIVRPGAKTFKSVSGYDISRIFYNSWGTMGFIIEMSFRILPLSQKDNHPHLSIFHPDYDAFKRELSSGTPLAQDCRALKDEFDPNNILPII